MARQTKNGKAFEYAILKEFEEKLQSITHVAVKENAAFHTAQKYFNSFGNDAQNTMLLYASFAVNFLIDVEPRLSHEVGKRDLLELEILTDDQGQAGDVRDVVLRRATQHWEIGISAKSHHKAVKHSRLSSKIDFGERWMGMPCSQTYFDEIEPIFTCLRQLQFNSNNTKTWKSLGDYHSMVYIPILQAFQKELWRLYATDPERVASRLVEYLLGKKDFYKVRKTKKGLILQPYNLHGTLNRAFDDRQPKLRTSQLKLPTKIIDITFKRHSNTTLLVKLNKGWSFSFRVHNASSCVEPSLKFDIRLHKAPKSFFANRLVITKGKA